MTIEAHGDEGIPHSRLPVTWEPEVFFLGLTSGDLLGPGSHGGRRACWEHICFVLQDVHVCCSHLIPCGNLT